MFGLSKKKNETTATSTPIPELDKNGIWYDSVYFGNEPRTIIMRILTAYQKQHSDAELVAYHFHFGANSFLV